MAPKLEVPLKKKAATPAQEPEAKKAKTDEAAAETKEVKPEKEEPKEQEIDAPADSRPGMKGTIGFDPSETTLNVIQASGGRVLMPLTDCGMSHLLAGARAGVGVKAGRYMYEVKCVESFSSGGGGGPAAKQVLRVGFSISGSPLILGDGDDCSLSFDSEGGFFVGKKRVPAVTTKKFNRGNVAAVVLNLDPKTPNVNTISLFVDGERASAPQAIPEEIRGKSLFPHVGYRSCTIQVHFGPEPLRPLPFKCRTIQSAAAGDSSKAKVAALVDGKHEVLFPVGFPDEGTFDWLDGFLEKNKQYVEISDRKIIDWAKKSGLQGKGQIQGTNDKPKANFGVPGLDDFSASRLAKTVAPLVPRHYVVMEVKNNLVEADRIATAKKFSSKHFKKVARVVMGEPSAEYKDVVKDKLLKKKQEKLDAAFKVKKAEKAKKKIIEQKQKEAAERKKKAEEARKALLEKKKKEAEDKKKKEAGEATEEKVEEEEVKKEEKEETKEEEKAEEKEESDAEPEKAELTEEESKVWFAKGGLSDLSTTVLEKHFGEFSIPSKSEGFDEIKFDWQKEKPSKEYLRNWVLERKRTSRIDSLQPSEWFKKQQSEFTKKIAEWQAKQKAAKANPKKKKADEDEESAGVDIFSVENVCDVGNGEPLFLEFEAHDWTLMSLRWELHLLAVAFKKDVGDPDREKIPEQHFAYYMNKYFKKSVNTKQFGKDNIKDVVTAYVKDTVAFEGEPSMFGSNLTEDAAPDMFVKLTEEKRRERQRRIDAGDETARLKFTPGGK